MAIKLLSGIYGKTVGTVISDLSYALEHRLVDAVLATYDLSSGTAATTPTVPAGLTQPEIDWYLSVPLSSTSLVYHGVYDYNDLATASSALVVPDTGAWIDIPNDGAGSFTNKTYALPGVADVWDTVDDAFDFTGLELGDTVDIRLDLAVTTAGPNAEVEVDLFLADGEAGEYQIEFADMVLKSAGAHPFVVFNSVYMGDANTRDNPALFKIKSDTALTVVVNGWYVRAQSRTGKVA